MSWPGKAAWRLTRKRQRSCFRTMKRSLRSEMSFSGMRVWARRIYSTQREYWLRCSESFWTRIWQDRAWRKRLRNWKRSTASSPRARCWSCRRNSAGCWRRRESISYTAWNGCKRTSCPRSGTDSWRPHSPFCPIPWFCPARSWSACETSRTRSIPPPRCPYCCGKNWKGRARACRALCALSTDCIFIYGLTIISWRRRS